MPRFSLILPTHNRADVLRYAIQSALSQTDGDFEMFVVGDGCTDHSGDVVRSVNDRRVEWLDLPKARFYGYANRNVALKRASGKFIAYLAHDDLLFPDHLERLAERLDAEGRDWIFSRPLWVSLDGIVLPYAVTLQPHDEFQSYFDVGNPIPMSCVMHRRSVIEYAGWWPEDVPSSADWAFWKQILKNGKAPSSYRVPTTLHFVADWRRSQNVGQPEALALLQLARSQSWWPAALRHSIAPGQTEQAALYEWMTKRGAAGIDELRAGVDLVIDRLAWERTGELRARFTAKPLWHRVLNRLRGSVTQTPARRRS